MIDGEKQIVRDSFLLCVSAHLIILIDDLVEDQYSFFISKNLYELLLTLEIILIELLTFLLP